MKRALPATLAVSVVIALLATLPMWLTNTYYVNVASQVLFWAIFALGLNVLVGYAGLTSLGHAALFAKVMELCGEDKGGVELRVPHQ